MFGGDEFVALLVDLTLERATAVVARMTDVQHLHAAGRQLSLRVGWASRGSTLTELLGRADTALYAATTTGRCRAVAVHDLVTPGRTVPAAARPGQQVLGPDRRAQLFGDLAQGGVPGQMAVQIVDALEVVDVDQHDGAGGSARTRVTDLNQAAGLPGVHLPLAGEAAVAARTSHELRAALLHEQLTLHYQPKMQVPGGAVCSLEALVRWDHPEHGLRYPDSFLPQIEQAGLMPP